MESYLYIPARDSFRLKFKMNEDYESRNRQIMLEGTQVLERTGESLARSHQIAIETENIGNEVVNELGEQREALLRTRNHLENANEQLNNAKTVTRKMARDLVYNKILLICIIIMELVILIILSYLKFFRKH